MIHSWLPAILDENACDIDLRYKLFRRDYIDQPPTVFAPKEFRVDDAILADGKEAAFFHLTTTGKDERQHDPYRCGRIEWGKPIVERVDTEEVVTWRVRQNGENRIKIALNDYAFLIVVAVDNASVRLVTAFYPHKSSGRLKIEREAQRALNGDGGEVN